MVLIGYSQNILKWTFQRNQFIFMYIGNSISNLFLIFYLIKFTNHFSIENVLLIYMIIRIIFSGVGVYLIRSWFYKNIKFEILKKIILFSIPFGLIGIIIVFLPVIERTFILNFFGSFNLGLYSAATKIAIFVLLPIEAFNLAWHPLALSLHKNLDSHVIYNFVSKFYILIMSFVCILVTAASPLFFALISKNGYSSSSILVFSLSMTLVLEHFFWNTSIGISIKKKINISIC